MAGYHMNRKDKQITERRTLMEILRQGKFCSVAMCRGGEPYVATLNYGYDEAKSALYFHCALKGLKLEFIESNPKVCATVIDDGGYKSGECDHAYRSVVLWGTMHLVEELKEKKHALEVLLNHLENDPADIRERNLKSDEAYEKVGIMRLKITKMTGKQGE